MPPSRVPSRILVKPLITTRVYLVLKPHYTAARWVDPALGFAVGWVRIPGDFDVKRFMRVLLELLLHPSVRTPLIEA